MKNLAVVVFLMISAILNPLFAQDSRNDEAVVRKVADHIINVASFNFTGDNGKTYASASDLPDGVQVKISDKFGEWRYTNGVINMAMLNLGQFLNDPKYTDFTKHHIAFAFDNYQYFKNKYQGEKSAYSYPFGQMIRMGELDDCGAMGASIIEVYQIDKKSEYRGYIDKAAHHIIQEQERLNDGTLVRRFPHEMTLWGDDLYMSVPFLARMGNLTGDWKYYDDGVRQVLNFSKYLWDPQEQLYFHNYYSDVDRQGVAHWGRVNGWIMMAQVHLLDYLPENHPLRKQILDNLRRQILGVAKYQDGNGLWHQVLDRSDSYEETSCTAMFVYSIAHAVNKGWIDSRYASIALAGWKGLKQHEITDDGLIKNVCVGTGIQDNMAFYYNRPAHLEDKHAIGSVIDAGVAIIKLKNSMKGD